MIKRKTYRVKEKNLVRVSDLEKRLKKACEISNFKARHVHVIGAGTMGRGIATWCALKGIRVTLQLTFVTQKKSKMDIFLNTPMIR